MKYKRIIALLAAVALCVSMCGCETYDNFKKTFFGEEEPEKTVRIGVFEPLTGEDAAGAEDEIKGIELAHKLNGEALGLRVELVYADNQSGVESAAAAAEKLAEEGADMVLGSYKSVLTLAGADIFEAAEIPVIGITCLNPIITQTNSYCSRVCVTEEYQSAAAASFVINKLEEEKAVVFTLENDDSAAVLSENFSKHMSTGESSRTVEVCCPDDSSAYTYYFEQMAAIGIKAVFFPSSAENAEKVIYEACAGGFDFTWIGTSRWSSLPDAAQAAGRADMSHLNNVYYTVDYAPDADITEVTQKFRAEYFAEYGTEPTEAAALGFDAYNLALESIKSAGSTSVRKLFLIKLKCLSDYHLATGRITFDPQGDPIKDVVIEKFTDGSASSVCTVAPVKGE